MSFNLFSTGFLILIFYCMYLRVIQLCCLPVRTMKSGHLLVHFHARKSDTHFVLGPFFVYSCNVTEISSFDLFFTKSFNIITEF